jgi:hypothetical protein
VAEQHCHWAAAMAAAPAAGAGLLRQVCPAHDSRLLAALGKGAERVCVCHVPGVRSHAGQLAPLSRAMFGCLYGWPGCLVMCIGSMGGEGVGGWLSAAGRKCTRLAAGLLGPTQQPQQAATLLMHHEAPLYVDLPLRPVAAAGPCLVALPLLGVEATVVCSMCWGVLQLQCVLAGTQAAVWQGVAVLCTVVCTCVGITWWVAVAGPGHGWGAQGTAAALHTAACKCGSTSGRTGARLCVLRAGACRKAAAVVAKHPPPPSSSHPYGRMLHLPATWPTQAWRLALG